MCLTRTNIQDNSIEQGVIHTEQDLKVVKARCGVYGNFFYLGIHGRSVILKSCFRGESWIWQKDQFYTNRAKNTKKIPRYTSIKASLLYSFRQGWKLYKWKSEIKECNINITSIGGNWESNYIKKTAEKLFVEDLITPVY